MAALSLLRPTLLGAAAAAAGASASVGLGVLTRQLDADVSLLAVGCFGGLLGTMSSPPVRRWLQPRAASARGVAVLLTACVVMTALLSLLGLCVLVPVATATAGIRGVLLRPTRVRQLEALLLTGTATAAAVGAQQLGWVPGVVSAPVTVLLAGVLLLLVWSLLSAAAQIARQGAAASRSLEEAARLDALTGLLGRRGLEEPLRRAAAAASPEAPTAVLFVDLDGFKAVNDVHGHAAGDVLLQVVGQRLQRCVRDGDSVARTGGDEFVLVLARLRDEAEARSIARRVSSEVSQPVVLDDGSWVGVGASTGVVTTSAPGDPDQLLSAADTAMYEAKRASRLARRAAPAAAPGPGPAQAPAP